MSGRRDVEAFLARLWALDDLLAEHGYPRMSKWWRATVERFYRSGRRRIVIRKGRRVGASTIVAPRLCVAEMLWGAHKHTPGAPPLVFAFLSVKREEASNRLRGIKAVLDTLGEIYHESGDSIELESSPCIAKVVTASYRASVGDTIGWCWCDEVARWLDEASGRNPAESIVSSIAPALATLINGTLWLVSSPWSLDDYHARQFDQGDTKAQCVAFGETWVINPTLTEEATRELEPHGPTWEREYAARPGATLSTAIDPADHARCYGKQPTGKQVRGFVCIDSSALRGDTFAFCGGYVSSGGQVVVAEVGGWDDTKQRTVNVETIVSEIADRARAWRTKVVFADPYERTGLTALFSQNRVNLRVFDWSGSEKEQAMQWVRRVMRENVLLLPDHEMLRRQLTNLKARLLPSGQQRYETNGLDYASTIITLGMASVAGAIPGARPRRKTLLQILSDKTPEQRAQLLKTPGRTFDLNWRTYK